MAGHFELFTDYQFRIRFQLVAADGRVLAVSGTFGDKRAAAKAISELRECAGTGLIRDHSGMTTVASRPKPDLAARLEDLMLNSENLEDFVASLTAVAASTVSCGSPGTACRITINRPKRHPVTAWSGPLARSLDELENNLGEGPGLTAMTEQRTILASDLNDDARWPRLAKSAAERGIRSCLGIPLEAEGQRRAVLSVTAATSNAFSHDDIKVAGAFAEQASKTLRSALRIAELNDTVRDLHAALEHRTVIDSALGVVMSQNHCDHGTAFEILRRAASARGTKLRDVAASVVASVSGDPDITVHFDP